MSVAGFVVFSIVMVATLGAINFQVFRWARKAFSLPPRALAGLKAVLALSLAGMVLGRVAGRVWPGPLTSTVIAVSSTIELSVILSAVLLLFLDAAQALGKLTALVRRRTRAPVSDAIAARPTELHPGRPRAAEQVDTSVAKADGAILPRRSFVTQAAAASALLVGSSSSLYGALRGRLDYQLEEVPLRVRGLSRSLDGFTIAQLSDVHIGAFVGRAELPAAEDLVRRAKPDLIVLTGDLIDNDARLAGELGFLVRRLSPLARHGVVAITGNHDFFAGADEMAEAVRLGGGRILRNEGLIIGDSSAGIALLGVDDVWARRSGGGPDLAAALTTLPEVAGRVTNALDLPRVLLCHNPSFFEEAAGSVALQLSGHTHGGQVNFGIRPADYVLPGGWVAGPYALRDSTLYVNRGFGTVGPPARLGAPPEVSRLLLLAS